jgi:hypothetical protein
VSQSRQRESSTSLLQASRLLRSRSKDHAASPELDAGLDVVRAPTLRMCSDYDGVTRFRDLLLSMSLGKRSMSRSEALNRHMFDFLTEATYCQH